MATIDVRELGRRAERVVRRAQRQREAITLTDGGRVIARIEPVTPEPPGAEAAAALLADMQRLAQRIGRQWPDGVSAVEALSQDRRDL